MMVGIVASVAEQSAGLYGSHPYWRVFCSDNWGGAGIIIAEVEFLNGVGAVISAIGGVAIGSDDALANEFSKAFNGTGGTSSWYANSGPTNQWIGYNYPTPVSVEGVRLTLADGGTNHLAQMPRNCKLEFSDDGSSWTTAFSFFNVNLSGAVLTYPEESPAAGKHKFWRVFCANNNGGSLIVLNEVELRATAGGADQVPVLGSNNGTSTARPVFSAQAAGNDAYRAFDGTTTGWATTTITNQFIGALFAVPVAVEEIALHGASTASRSPKDITVDYSDDGTTWTTQKALAPQTAWGASEIRVLAAK